MEDILAPVNDMIFDVEVALENQIGALPLPFPGMDKSGAAVCVFHLKGTCSRAASCPYRHIKGDRTVVCKHWLRGLCKKGDMCEFLHEYDMTKMPECFFYSRFQACSNKECPFLHIDPESKIKDCPWYDRGFCRHGPSCRHRHTRRVLCINYLCGFCPEGPNCKFVHPRFDLPLLNEGNVAKKGVVTCHYCNEPGHKIYQCPKMPPDQKGDMFANKQNQFQQSQHEASLIHNQNNGQMNDNRPRNEFKNQQRDSGGPGGGGGRNPRPLDQVTCFKCGEKGHYANKCPKGNYAFLSPHLNNVHQVRN